MAGLLDSYINSLLAAGNGNTGFMRPATAYNAQASLLNNPQQAAPASNNSGILGQLLGGLKGADYSNLGPTLLNLGAGIAGSSGQGWGPGIGAGLASAGNALQQQREMALKKQAYDLQLAELKNTMDYQKQSLGISQQNANTSESTRKDALDIRRQAALIDEAKAGSGFSQIAAAAPQWAEARKSLLTEGLGGRWETATGPGIGVMKNALLGASKITGENPQTLFDTYVPTAADGIETRTQKVQAFEGFMKNLSGLKESYPSFGPQFKSLNSFAPETPPSNPATTTSVPMGGAPQQPTQADTIPIPGAIQGPNARPIPTPDKLQILRQYANNPEARAAFDDIYGPGAADHFLQGGR